LASGWLNLHDNSTCDLFSTHSSINYFSTPQNYFGYQIPFNRNNYADLGINPIVTKNGEILEVLCLVH
jgi:hypothetical protein